MVEKVIPGQKNLKFPIAIYFIIAFEYLLRFSYNSIQDVIPLYLVDILRFKDDEATVIYHSYLCVLLTSCIVGGIIADSFLGKFKSIILFSVILAMGMITLSASATPPLHLPVGAFTAVGMMFAAFGYGALKPVAIAFGAAQFVLPQQAKQLSLLFVLLCMAENSASVTVSLITPVLRKDLTCFGQLTCYSLVFIVPAVLLVTALAMLLATKRFYKIDRPEGNIVVKITKCMLYAICQKFKSKEKQKHWLDYAKDKYELELIEDIKSVNGVLKLLFPLVIFWSLFSSQATFWIYQASRMNGEFIGGYLVKPDQTKLANPLSVIIFGSIYHPYVAPFLAKYFALNKPLRRITFGCFIAALSYYTSAILELNLEPTYAKVPTKGLAQLRIYNTIDCNMSMTVDQQNFVLNELDFWQNINIPTNGTKSLAYEIDFSKCDNSKIKSKRVSGQLDVTEKQATSWALNYNGLDYKFIDDIEKSNSGNPLIRTLIYVDDDFPTKDLFLNVVSKGEILEKFKIPDNFMKTESKEVAHKVYDMYLNDKLVEPKVPIKVGGVYTILGYVSNTSMDVHTVTVTDPNSLHIFWVLPQLSLLGIAEIIVYAMVMDFAYSQSPDSMKAFIQAYWLFLGLFGNLIVITITEAHLFERKLYTFLLYGTAMTVSGIVFGIGAKFYTPVKPKDNNTG